MVAGRTLRTLCLVPVSFQLGVTETRMKEGSPYLLPQLGICPFKDASSQSLGFSQLKLVLAWGCAAGNPGPHGRAALVRTRPAGLTRPLPFAFPCLLLPTSPRFCI